MVPTSVSANQFFVRQSLYCLSFSIHKLVPPSTSANWFPLQMRSWFPFAAANWFSFSILKLGTLQEPQTGSSCSSSVSWFLFSIRKLVPLQKTQTGAYKQVFLQHLQTGSHFSSESIHKLFPPSAYANWFLLQHLEIGSHFIIRKLVPLTESKNWFLLQNPENWFLLQNPKTGSSLQNPQTASLARKVFSNKAYMGSREN